MTTVDDGDTLSIHKRPSGGRGEYELVGRQGPRVASEFEGVSFQLETPWGVKPSNLRVDKQGGKLRLRLEESRRDGHLAPQVASLLLMPPPTREEDRISRALPIVIDQRYILDIDIAVVEQVGNTAVIRPTSLVTRSGDIDDDRLSERIAFATRAAQVRQLHDAAGSLPDGLASLMRQHAELVDGPAEIGAALRTVVDNIISALDWYDAYYLPGTDPLPALRVLAGVSGLDEIAVPTPPETPEDAPDVRLRAEHIYRLQRARGAAASAFRLKVQTAYDYRCVFCGLRAPRQPGRMNSGVDAAHILPWGAYDLDVVPNGLMLCKQHHWAFDNRVLRLDLGGGVYRISMIEDARALLAADARTVELLDAVCGEVPSARLPHKLADRPAKKFLDEYNELVVHA
ncbi:HNH endonuclease [Cellulomonas uda]|uniref:HNH nuclease domain-containing protein n=1 Tax=Cellulomonas uda TaxID=1714 RepID=A0A4Y3KD17_CELUD|nr:HNH endonuclease [Cellulomonas uda]NII67847.1 hypothetical protein [Cellulomonas uda]GEA82369.1 hypothetical protein CUD01_28130 [Cellulomonas uda]